MKTVEPAMVEDTALVARPSTRGNVVWLAVKERPSALVGLFIVLFFIVVAVFGPVLAPHSATQQSGPVFAAPSAQHWLGTDDSGVDVLSEMLAGGRTSLIVGFAAALVAMIVGGGVGLLAGYAGGTTDVTLMRITDYFLVIPDLVLMIVIVTVFGPSRSLVILVIGLLLWTSTARIVRSQVKSIRERVYVRRARSLGASHRRIVFQHVLPQVAPLLIATTVLSIAYAIFDESALAFLGVGVPGRLVGQHARTRLRTHGDDAGRVVGVRAARPGHRPHRHRLLPDGPGHRGRAEPAPARGAPVHQDLAVPGRVLSLLEARDLNVWFDLPHGGQLHAVQGVSFGVNAGERLGLVGESGCGKTTALLALMGLLPPSAQVSGSVTVNGEELLAGGEDAIRPHRWTDVAMVFQGAMNALNPVKTVGSQIVEPMKFHGTASGAAAETQAGELLELVGLPASAAKRFPHEFSGGMRQRAAIAMALACNPKVLLADEPTTALDVMVQAQILQLLESLTADLGLALILVTHDLPLVTQVCERAVVMYAGRVAEAGSGRHALPRPTAPVHAPAVRGHARPRGHGGRGVHPGRPAAARSPHRRVPLRAAMRSRVRALRGPHAGARERGRRAPGSLPSERPRVRRARDACGGRAVSEVAVDPVRGQEGALLLDVRDLVVHYPVRRDLAAVVRREPAKIVAAVDGVSLSVKHGEMLALIGESGCGKTSTAQAILRMIDVTSGTIEVGGRDITHMKSNEMRPIRKTMQMVYQDPYESLDPRFRVRRAVEEPLLIHGMTGSGDQRERAIVEALERVELSPADLFIDRYPHELSGGQRQRVAIAASLVLEPTLLLADEPVSMLDVSVRAGILALLDRLRRESDMGIVMITHDLSTAAHFADRIAVMYLGRIVEEGPAMEVVSNPQHPYTKALMSVVPKRDPRDKTEPQILQGETPNPINVPTGCHFHPRCPVAEERCKVTDPRCMPRAAGQAVRTEPPACWSSGGRRPSPHLL